MTDFDFPDDEDEADFVRPFLVTPGRTHASVEGLRFETLVQATSLSGAELRFEPARVWELCHDALALAEISAQLGMPIGTVKVVASDLIESGHLAVHDTVDAQHDVALISRLIEGVRRL